ncbi:MAG: hypothetical protein QM764_12505 [Chitinophagaceae bacterium]
MHLREKAFTAFLFFILSLVIVSCSSPAIKQDNSLLCSVRIDSITPTEPVFLAGFANRNGMSDTVHRPLRTKCVVLKQDTTIVCLIFNDLMEVAKEYDDHIRQMISDSAHIPVSAIFIMSSHSHSTPIMDLMHLNQSEANDRYREKAINTIAKNAIKAVTDKEKFVACNRETASAMCTMNTNRRAIDPKTGEAVIGKSGAGCDHEVQLLRLVSNNGDVLTTIFNYACHPVTLGWASKAVSPDYVGKAEETIAQKTGGLAFFMHGAAGDVNPVNALGTSLSATDSEGVKLANAVLASSFTKDTSELALKVISSSFMIPYRDQEITSAFIDNQVKNKSAQKTDFTNWKEAVATWGERMKKELSTGKELPKGRTVNIGAVRLGSTVIFFTQGEFFNRYQLELKKQFPRLHILFAGYTNGEAGYVPDGEAFKAKGYEVDQAYIFIGEPSSLSDETEGYVMKNMKEIVNRVLQ